MITLAKEYAVNRSSLNGRPGTGEMTLSVQGGAEIIHCFLEISRTRMPIDVPAQLLAEHRRSGLGDIVLNVAADQPRTEQPAPRLTRRQQREANRWLAEMEDFDRF